MKTDTDSFRDGVQSERWGVAPSFSWGIGTKDEFNLSYYKLKGDNTPDFGVPYFRGKPLNVPIEHLLRSAQRRLPARRHRHGDGRAGSIASATTPRCAPCCARPITTATCGRLRRACRPTPTFITDATGINRQAQRRGGVEHTLTSQTDFNTKLEPRRHAA